MLFSGVLEVDPSQMTLIKRVKPSKLFSKFIDVITLGTASEKEEHETFTAVTILQQINMGLRAIDIKNVVRLAVDNYDFYLDEKGEEDDLEQAMLEFKAKADPLESELFNTIYLVLEHLEGNLKYLVEISISRKHKVGEYPIKITVNGVLDELRLKPGETHEDLKRRMESIFVSQNDYDEYITRHKQTFDGFVDRLELGLKKFIKIDNVRKTSSKQIVRPQKKVTNAKEINHERYSEPAFYGYYGFDSYMLYTFLWSGMLYNNNIYVNDVLVVDDMGHDVMAVGENGFYAGDTNTFNEEAAFEPPPTSDVEYFAGSEYDETIAEVTTKPLGEDTLVTEGSGWLETGSVEESSSCSSCSSCGSCSD